MKNNYIRLVLLFTVSMFVSIVAGQDIERPTITPENAEEVELLALVGWFDGLQTFDYEVDLVANPLWVTWTIAFNADGTRFALGNDNNEVILFDVIDEPPFIIENTVLRAHEGPVYSLAFHPDGQHLASGSSDGMIYVWDIITGEITQTIESYPKSAVYGLAYSPDGEQLRCATFMGEGDVRQYSDVNRCSTSRDTSTAIYSVSFSSDGVLYAYGDTVIRNLETFAIVTLPTRRSWSDSYKSSRSRLTFSVDGSVLLNGGTTQDAYIWHVDDLLNPVVTGWGMMALSPDGSLVAGRNLVIIDSITGEQLLSLESPDLRFGQDSFWSNLPYDAIFSPDGTLIITANVDGTIRIWGIPSN